MSRRILLEVCTDSLEGAIRAEAEGADRLELNSALSVGGLTPSIDLLRAVKQSVRIPVIAMLRPREGDFHCNGAELKVMRRDLDRLLDAGADGLAFGVLNPDHTIDTAACRGLLRVVRGKPTVFHRAFDETPDALTALDQLIDLGFTRLLTSGQAQTALQGADIIRSLIDRSAGRIEILPGAGINLSNVQDLIRTTRCDQVHGTFKQGVKTIRARLDEFILKTV